MAYQALYRVWRSQRFDAIIGQQAITQTLKNAIASQKTSHAYLFTGPRGTGKTSAAKIFAKAINCPNQKDGEPCNECEICKAITAGRLNDVMEIDAASNNGVDEIRELRDKVKYAPTQGKYKVYIIDEVHMLSQGAFNALLKTLEEPPKSVIFILATTEPHKIPATIISRTQRFDFKKISVTDIVPHLANILEDMSISYEKEALYVVAKAAEGGMRDALSILDQAISFGGDKVTQKAALEVTGSLSTETLVHFLQAVTVGNVEKALEELDTILQKGKEPKRFLENLMETLRDVLMYQKAPQFLESQATQIPSGLKELAKELSAETIYENLKILNEAQQDLRFTNEGRLYLEVTTVKLATPKIKKENLSTTTNLKEASSQEVLDLKEKISALEKQVEKLLQQAQEAPNQEKIAPVKKRGASTSFHQEIPKEKVYQVLKQATRENLQQVRHHWEDVLQLLSPSQKAMLKACEPVAASPNALVVVFDYEILSKRAQQDEELQEAVKIGFQRLCQYAPSLVAIPRESWPKLRQNFLEQRKIKETSETPEEKEEGSLVQLSNEPVELVPEVVSDDLVEKAQNFFGSEIVEIVND